MAINQNHPFEDIDGVRCAVVEKNCSQPRVDFLQSLLEFNGYTVLVRATPPPKPAAPVAKLAAEGETAPVVETPPPPSTFTIVLICSSFSEFSKLCPNIKFWDLYNADSIKPIYDGAIKEGGIHVIVEYPELYYVN